MSNRREFFQKSALSIAGAAAMSNAAQAAAANERTVVGFIGPGGMGTNHLKQFVTYKDVQVAYVCDPDVPRLAAAAKLVESTTGTAPKAVTDMRTVLDDKTVDAVIIATPDHWHAPATILACAAGKHVYVEKPCSHNIREGRLMIEAVRKHNRVVQVGTQSRSSAHVERAIQLIRDGAIGDVLSAKVWNSHAAARSTMPNRASRLLVSISTLGSAPRRCVPTRQTCSLASGGGGTTLAAATWGTMASTTSTSPVGGWASRRIRPGSPQSAASIILKTINNSPIPRR